MGAVAGGNQIAKDPVAVVAGHEHGLVAELCERVEVQMIRMSMG